MSTTAPSPARWSSPISLIRLDGDDTRRFLHGQSSQAIELAPAGACLPTCLISPTGRMRALALVRLDAAGADLLVLPAAWVRGPLKEHHWATLLAARALDTTCYLVAAGECGNKNIGPSRIVDPQGVTVAAAAQEAQLIFAEVSATRVQETREKLPILRHRRFAPPQLL